MSCDGENSFGYVTIEDGKVVSYTGAPEDPEIHKFCNDEIVQAVKLKELVEKRAGEFLQLANSNVLSGDRIDDCKKTFTVLNGLLEESEK